MRIGSGLDMHAFSADLQRPLVLGGVVVPGAPGLAGHSDADVVAHALADALLGAAALGDLGSLFGVDDPALARADSLTLLRRVVDHVTAAGWRTANIDCTVIAERPRLDGHRQAMRERLAAVVNVPVTSVSVKVTSTDGLGAVGRGEGIACWATCLIVEGREREAALPR
ncbi:MAG: 2-C-methyl-D-erythritol 2,4-cyclodiphosphate synthase [Actinomycetota bacterium]|nr:2-C-methyl-D-erythritol 2,4-cyclodiphosphate synthase [Actinomycetota bacterium]